MADTGSPLPPEPLLSAGAAPDVPPSGVLYSAEKDFNDSLAWLEKNAERAGAAVGSLWDFTKINETSLALLTKIFGYLLKGLADIELTLDKEWLAVEKDVYSQVLPDLIPMQQQIDAVNLKFLLEALAIAGLGGGTSFGGLLSADAQALFNGIVMPFTLLNSQATPDVRGSGFQNQAFLLSQAMNLALTTHLIDNASNHMGMGLLKTIQPFLSLVDRSVHPTNVIRQAMDASYALLLKAPLTRDLNRKYPVKDLGLTALAHLRNRGAIPEESYFDRCLDAGLNQEGATQLLLESSRQISESDIGKLLNRGIITLDDAQRLMTQQGYDPRLAETVIHLRTHDRNEAVLERVGYAAVSAWVRGKLAKSTMEDILHQTGFTDFEITTLELEQDFAKTVPEFKPLTYSDVKRLFEANIIGIDEVVTFLEGQNYSPADVQNLVLLDFTVAAERQTRQAVLIARARVQAETARVQAAAAQVKNETALANAKKTLASELDAEAKLLGTVSAVPGILALTGHIP
jgi:hypothetical protein